MKIVLLSHDLSHNCLGRAVVLAQAFARRHEVEIVGPALGNDIWYPCRKIGLPIRRIEGEMYLPQSAHLFARILEKIQGDLVMAIKPRPTSFGAALMHRALTGQPIAIDIDDDEMAYQDCRNWESWNRHVLLGQANSPLYTALLEDLIPSADCITVASRRLQKRHGGIYLPHVKDPAILDPARYDRKSERILHGIDVETRLIVFAGTPREHKGLDILIRALNRLGRDDVRLLIVGAVNDPNNAFENGLRQLGGERVQMLKQTPMSHLPAILSMADLVVLPQHECTFACSQMPSKLFDAMAMGLPIIASAVSDIPEVLEGDCGVIVPPDNDAMLAVKIAEVQDSPEWAARLGRNARQRLIERYSIDTAQAAVDQVIERLAPEAFTEAIPS